ncbi:hypothetical protein CYY_007839 [Polysphondylium violaceum]|uniref:Uncharacterized protein n=1 Tax=Polysphondylium violaceum TaxID=133409 RepID=A0A8J4PQ91_9MYCE|nr:hypothetical protein CYY_007839 [Polysphondylium violaceum]
MIKVCKASFFQGAQHLNAAKVFQPASLVLHGNKYLESLSQNSKSHESDVARKSLESMNIKVNDDNKFVSAKDWVQELHDNGMGSLILSRSKQRTKTIKDNEVIVNNLENFLQRPELDFVIVSSKKDSDSHQAWTFTQKENEKNQDLILTPEAKEIATSQALHDYLVWRDIALGDIRERIREAVERMRDFSILHIKNLDLSQSEQSNYLNNLAEAEKFIHMNVMLTTKREMDKLFDFLQLPREYTSSSQARVALQILNAAMCAWIFDYPTKGGLSNKQLNEDYKRLSNELYESVLDSITCSTNYINKEL